jgi:DNA integrity scanning protein DisA with diadenylate cyclase activity
MVVVVKKASKDHVIKKTVFEDLNSNIKSRLLENIFKRNVKS